MAPTATATRVLDVAENLMQTRGWSAVSYADLAEHVGIRSASIHHHFASKALLGRELVERYNRNFHDHLARLEAESEDARVRLSGYFAVLRASTQDASRLCLCTMLAAEYAVLPDEMRERVTAHADSNLEWLEALLRSGSERGEFVAIDEPALEAQAIYAEIQGAQLIARCYNDISRFDLASERIQSRLTASP